MHTLIVTFYEKMNEAQKNKMVKFFVDVTDVATEGQPDEKEIRNCLKHVFSGETRTVNFSIKKGERHPLGCNNYEDFVIAAADVMRDCGGEVVLDRDEEHMDF